MAVTCQVCQMQGLEWSENVNSQGKHFLFGETGPHICKPTAAANIKPNPIAITTDYVLENYFNAKATKPEQPKRSKQIPSSKKRKTPHGHFCQACQRCYSCNYETCTRLDSVPDCASCLGNFQTFGLKK